jgi:hypothetical protein
VRTTHIPPALVHRSDEVETDELRRDLSAVGINDAGAVDVDAVLTRPTLLRRIAALVAVHVPATADRLVAATTDAPLAAAVGLHTGLSFALLDSQPTSWHGELYPAEQAIAIGILDIPSALTDAVDRVGAHVLATIAVVSAHCAPGWRSKGQTQHLFALADLHDSERKARR